MTRILFLLLPVALAGCVNDSSTDASDARNRVYTVEEFVAQPKLRQQYGSFCSNNPGQFGKSPNCINVRRAEHIASAGTTIPSFAP